MGLTMIISLDNKEPSNYERLFCFANLLHRSLSHILLNH
jgi:hypothetical protein